MRSETYHVMFGWTRVEGINMKGVRGLRRWTTKEKRKNGKAYVKSGLWWISHSLCCYAVCKVYLYLIRWVGGCNIKIDQPMPEIQLCFDVWCSSELTRVRAWAYYNYNTNPFAYSNREKRYLMSILFTALHCLTAWKTSATMLIGSTIVLSWLEEAKESRLPLGELEDLLQLPELEESGISISISTD